MARYLKTDSKRIESDAEEIEKLAGEIPKLLDELKDAMFSLDRCWEGDAWNAYQNTNAYYIEVLSDVYNYYEKYAANLVQASTDYMRAEQDVMDEIDSWFL